MKVLIVDDERSVHEQLKQIIPWEELGWRIVGHAYNGEEAKCMTADRMPHLIITDIKMPLVDGLGYMEWLQASEVAAKVIVLSGYEDFEYIRPAFKNGAIDYLLKPVQQAELLIVLGKVVEQLNEESRAMEKEINEKSVLNMGIVLMQDQLMSEIIEGSLQEENEMIVRGEQILLQLPERGYYVIVASLTDFDKHVNSRYEKDRFSLYYAVRNVLTECLKESGLKGDVFRNLQKSNEFLLLVTVDTGESIQIDEMLRRLNDSIQPAVRLMVKLGVSLRKTRLEHLRVAYREGVEAIESLKLGEAGGIAYSKMVGEIPPERRMELSYWKELREMLELLIKTGSLRDQDALLSKFEQAMKDEALMTLSGIELKQAFRSILKAFEALPQEDTTVLTLLESVKASVNELRIDQLKQQTREMLEYVLQNYNNDLTSKSGRQLVGTIIQYTTDYYRTVTLEEVSNKFYINKNYFCSLFKSETGESYLEFLTKVRMEEAKRLLKDSDLKAYEIAELVGYSDQRYFSQVFRKHTGMKPTDYRKASVE